MTDVFDVLAADHAEVKRMLAELEAGPTRDTGAAEDQLQLRKKMTEQLILEESWHETLEEMYFWPAVREHVMGGEILADKAIGQEREGRRLQDELGKADPGDDGFEQLLATFIQACREHMRFEEGTIWPRALVALPAQTAAALGTRIAEGKGGRT